MVIKRTLKGNTSTRPRAHNYLKLKKKHCSTGSRFHFFSPRTSTVGTVYHGDIDATTLNSFKSRL